MKMARAVEHASTLKLQIPIFQWRFFKTQLLNPQTFQGLKFPIPPLAPGISSVEELGTGLSKLQNLTQLGLNLAECTGVMPKLCRERFGAEDDGEWRDSD